MKRRLFGLTSGITLVFVAVLLNSCTMVPVVIDPKYREMIRPPIGSERVIDQVTLSSDKVVERNSSDGYPSAPSNVSLGMPYNAFESKKGPKRHRDEAVLDKLSNSAKEMYPNEAVDIRKASIVYKKGYQWTRSAEGANGRVFTTYYAQFPAYYVADVVIAESIPEPVTHSLELSLADVSRADLYRRIANWLADEKYVEDGTVAGVRLETDLASGVDLGRIKGDYIFFVSLDHNYIITSTFTIDVHDEKAEISFKNTYMQMSRRGDEEPIILQSVANAAKTEIVSFSERLKNSVTR